MASRNYRKPEALKDEMKKITERMLEDGIIKHSTSSWNSPILLAKESWMPQANRNGDW
jgi:hypothetical protein